MAAGKLQLQGFTPDPEGHTSGKFGRGPKYVKFFPALFQTDLNNRSQETNDKKGIQFHGVVTNNRIFNLIHSVQEKKFSLFSFNQVQGLQELWAACGTSRARRVQASRAARASS